jgi:hypothetical protein
MHRRTFSRGRLVAAVAAVLAGSVAASPARATDESPQELRAQLDALKARLEQLEAKAATAPSSAPVDTARADAAIDAAVRDADRRSSLLDAGEGFTAGFSNGKFTIQSADGNFKLTPGIGFQFRYVGNYREDAKNVQADDAQTGFEVRRLKFNFEGNLFSPDLTYRFQWNTNRKTGNPELDEGWVRYQFHDTPFAVKLGSMPLTFDHESAVSYTQQLAVERSLLHELLSAGAGGDDYVQGVQFLYETPNSPLRGFLMYDDGANSRNTNFQDGGGGLPLLGLKSEDWAVNGRVEYKFAGDWKQYNDFNALNSKADLLVVGAGFDYEDSNNVTALFHTVDVQWQPGAVKGLSLYAAYIGIHRDFRNAPAAAGTTNSPYDWGFIAQAGYFLDPQWEVFGRYDLASLDSHAPTGTGTLGAGARIQDTVQEITVGVNYFLHGHNAKFTVDAGWLPGGSPFNLDSAGILAQPTNKDQFLVRAQFQLAF